MSLGSARHQKPGQPGRTERTQGEAERGNGRDEARPARQETEGLGQADLLTQALARANLVAAWKRVKANRGSAGADGLDIEATAEHLKTHWPRIREELQTGRYRPQPVRRVQIPKSGGGMRELGIPSVTDRLIQQALLQVLQPMIDPTFSESSYGFRPGRRAHDAVLQAQRHVQEGFGVVVEAQAIPSYAPKQATEFFKKIECFCFKQQTLTANESREMPVVFVIDPDLPKDVKTITLSYTFLEIGKPVAQAPTTPGKGT